MHSHFSEFNDNAETLSHVTVDNGACVTTKLRQNLKVTTFLSAFLGSYSLRFGNLRRGNRSLKYTLNETTSCKST